MDRLKRNASTLKLLHGAKPSFQKAVLKKSKDDFVKCVCDISYNVLKGTAPISKQHKKRLSRHKSSLRKLIDRKLSLKKKEKSDSKWRFSLGVIDRSDPCFG